MDGSVLIPDEQGRRPYALVLGNEKGGSGKSTTAMQLIVALLRLGYSVGSIDLDARQGSLSRYLRHREHQVEQAGLDLPLPSHFRVFGSEETSRRKAEAQERERLQAAFAALSGSDFLVIDTPGSDSHLSRLGHLNADTLITPVNDSYLDLDVIAEIDRERREVLGPSVYSQMVWEQNNQRVLNGRRPIDWVVMRNRLSHIEPRNKREIGELLQKLGQRIGFRLAPGFGERVVYRELFLKGMTVLDLPAGEGSELVNSHLAARREIGELLRSIGLLQDQEA
ncbi:MAG: division plane positioning ATPase MipZ [Kiloniellales bacterium]|nr:division plane positioning ATPase MipZ [Kiloniellales bacterium]MDJ0980059.1 division plane positioning ATPase MipZ [Kiloniellales bacterium]